MYNKQVTIEGAEWSVNLDRGDSVLDNSMFNQGFAGQNGSREVRQAKPQVKEAKVSEAENIELKVETLEEPAKLDNIEETFIEHCDDIAVEEVVHKKRGRKPKTTIIEADENKIEGEENELQNDTNIYEG